MLTICTSRTTGAQDASGYTVPGLYRRGPLTAISCGYRGCTSAAVWELQACRNKPLV